MNFFETPLTYGRVAVQIVIKCIMHEFLILSRNDILPLECVDSHNLYAYTIYCIIYFTAIATVAALHFQGCRIIVS